MSDSLGCFFFPIFQFSCNAALLVPLPQGGLRDCPSPTGCCVCPDSWIELGPKGLIQSYNGTEMAHGAREVAAGLRVREQMFPCSVSTYGSPNGSAQICACLSWHRTEETSVGFPYSKGGLGCSSPFWAQSTLPLTCSDPSPPSPASKRLTTNWRCNIPLEALLMHHSSAEAQCPYQLHWSAFQHLLQYQAGGKSKVYGGCPIGLGCKLSNSY